MTERQVAGKGRQLRGDIQALRAFAVLAVVGVHLWPEFLPGGFVGVDIFFVISGFLISSHLLDQIQRQGRVALLDFYARRIKRLLPAAFLVLIVSGIGVAIAVPWDRWPTHFTEIAAAAGYIHNLYLTLTSVDYHAAGQSASVAQHYWSLSVEEQFYFVWPVILMGLTFLASKMLRGRGAPAESEPAPHILSTRAGRTSLLTILTILAAIFFAFNLWFTWWSPKQAYFFTPVRFWEFMIGAAIAVLIPRITLNLIGKCAFSTALIGWGMLTLSLLLIKPTYAFPGWWALLPTVGTGLVIAAGVAAPIAGLSRITDLKPIRYLGDISYSLYLWHWPLIVLAPYFLRYSPRWGEKLGVLLLTLILAALTRHFVEVPGQNISLSNRRTYLAMATAVALIVGTTPIALTYARSVVDSINAQEQDFLTGQCVGPRALMNDECAHNINAPLFKTYLSDSSIYYGQPEGCRVLSPANANGLPEVSECDHSGGDPDAPVVYLLGDSHAQQWAHPMNTIAQRHGWRLRLLYKGGCPMAPLTLKTEDTAQKTTCTQMQKAVEEHLSTQSIDRIIHTTFAVRWAVEDGTARTQTQIYEDGLHQWWKQWRQRSITVNVIADSPLNGAIRQVECSVIHSDNPGKCAVPRSRAIPEAPLNSAVATLKDPGVRLTDLTDAFCDENQCYSSVGGMQIYFDYDHLQRQYTSMLIDVLEQRLALDDPGDTPPRT
ncbi:MAG: acyltransferase family protein [Actinomycetaceae bacterium]|nr:acyltransferase family protein [Actinomycetaceae bacterium]